MRQSRCLLTSEMRTAHHPGTDAYVIELAKYFENSLKELEARNPEVETSFKRIDAMRFDAVAYVNGEEQSRCGIWQGGGSSLMEGIMPIRLAQAHLIPRDSYVSAHFCKSYCRSAIPLGRQSSAHCRNPPLARIAG